MKTWWIVPALLFAVESNAATATYNFEGSHPGYPYDPPVCLPVGSLQNGGITATFGTAFAFSRTLATSTTDACNQPPGMLEDGLVAGRFASPSGEWAAFVSFQCMGDPYDNDTRSIIFSQGIRYFACDLYAVPEGSAWACYPYVLSADNGASWNTHVYGGTIPTGSIGSTSVVQMWGDATGAIVRASAYPAMERSWEWCGPEYPSQPSPYGEFHWDNTLTPMCNPQRIEMFSAIPVTRVFFRDIWGYPTHAPCYIDNVEVSTLTCPTPPCELSAVHDPPAEMAAVRAPGPAGVLVADSRTGRLVTPTKRPTWGQLKVLYR